MKNTKVADQLTAKASSVTWPGDNIDFHNFQASLRELVGLNFGYGARQSFGYDEYSKTFYWASDDETIINLRGTLIGVKRNFSIDPRKSIAEEFERVREEYASHKQAIRDAGKALRNIGGEVH